MPNPPKLPSPGRTWPAHSAFRYALPVALLGVLLLMGARPAHAAKPPPANYDESKVAPYELPDPLRCFDGSPVTDVAAWRSKRRPEILHAFATEMYGKAPPIAAKPAFDVTSVDKSALGGRATRKLVTV